MCYVLRESVTSLFLKLIQIQWLCQNDFKSLGVYNVVSQQTNHLKDGSLTVGANSIFCTNCYILQYLNFCVHAIKISTYCNVSKIVVRINLICKMVTINVINNFNKELCILEIYEEWLRLCGNPDFIIRVPTHPRKLGKWQINFPGPGNVLEFLQNREIFWWKNQLRAKLPANKYYVCLSKKTSIIEEKIRTGTYSWYLMSVNILKSGYPRAQPLSWNFLSTFLPLFWGFGLMASTISVLKKSSHREKTFQCVSSHLHSSLDVE